MAFLRSVSLQPLVWEDQDAIIRKICGQKTAQLLIDGLRNKTSLLESLDTPLFVTLLCVAYRAEQSIPETAHEFYDLVFNTLLYRHDALKPGFDRPRKSKLGNYGFGKVFESFSFYTAKVQLVRMSEERANQEIERALKNEAIENVSSDKYFEDLTKITCLIVRDGEEYQFLHKSFQDYFSARYIRRQPDDAVKHIYEQLCELPARTMQFQQILRFLASIDTFRYAKWFELPALDRVLPGSIAAASCGGFKFTSIIQVLALGGGVESEVELGADWRSGVQFKSMFSEARPVGKRAIYDYFNGFEIFIGAIRRAVGDGHVRAMIYSLDKTSRH